MRSAVREGGIFLLLLTLLALLMHPDLLTEPSRRFSRLWEGGNYLHPFAYAFVLYLLLWIFRGAFRFLRGLRKRKGRRAE